MTISEKILKKIEIFEKLRNKTIKLPRILVFRGNGRRRCAGGGWWIYI